MLHSKVILLKIIFITLILTVAGRSFKKTYVHQKNKDPLSVIPLPTSAPNTAFEIHNLVPVKPLNTISMENHPKKKSDFQSMENEVIHKEHKSKRHAYRKSWSGYGMNPPPYLVFNRKVGAYYPYYSFPTENSARRSYKLKKYGDETQQYNQYAGA